MDTEFDEAGAPPAVVSRAKKVGDFLWKALLFIADQWLLIGFGIACVLGYFFPKVAEHGGYIRSEYSILYGAVAIIFFINGVQLSPDKLLRNLTNWRLHVVVQGISFILIPLFMLVLIYICIGAGALHSGTPSPPILVGMLAAACLPTTIASNVVMTRNAGGDEAAAVISVVIGNLFGSFISPLLIYGYIPKSHHFDGWRPANPRTLGHMYAGVAKQLALSVVVPLLLGQALRWKVGDAAGKFLNRTKLNKVPSICLILLVWTTFSGAFGTGAIYKIPKPSIIFNIFMNLALYLVFTLICFYTARPPAFLARYVNPPILASKFLPQPAKRMLALKKMSKEETIAVCFCGAAKTTSLGIPLVSSMWASSDDLTRAYITVPVLLYTIEQVFMAQILVYYFRWYLRRDAPADPETPQAPAAPAALVVDIRDTDEETMQDTASEKRVEAGVSLTGPWQERDGEKH